MLVGLNIETSEEHNTRTMQYNAQWTKPALTDLMHAKTVAKMSWDDGMKGKKMMLM